MSQSVAFVIPLLPGKTETEREALASMHGIDLAAGFPPPEQMLDFRA